jgi:hypothetical protein
MTDADLFAAVFTAPRPCSLCRAAGPTFADGETGRALCLPCLEKAVDAAELIAERQDAARLCACFQLLPC